MLSFSVTLEASNAITPCAELNDKYIEQKIETKLWDKCEKDAAGGNSEAQFQFGLFLIRAHDNYKSIKNGLHWLEESAKNGKRLAQIAIGGFLSRKEMNLKLDLVRAYAWFSVAEEKHAIERVKGMMDNNQLSQGKKLANIYMEKYRSEW